MRGAAFAALLLTAVAAGTDGGDKPLTFDELMRFRTVHDAVVSRDGAWIAYEARPDRGDGEAVVRAAAGGTEHRVERGSHPALSADGRWAAVAVEPSFAEREKAAAKKGKGGDGKKDGPKKDGPKKGLALIDLGDGSERRYEKVDAFAFSEDGRWLAFQLAKEEKKDEEGEAKEEGTPEEVEPAAVPPEEAPPVEAPAGEAKPEEEAKKDDEKKKDEDTGSTLMLLDLASGAETTLENVTAWAFDEPSTVLAYAVAVEGGETNGLFLRRLGGDGPAEALHAAAGHRYSHLTWAKKRSLLAFLAAPVDAEGEAGDATLFAWSGAGEARRLAGREEAPEGFTLPAKNELRFSRDGARLYFGFKPVDAEEEKEKEKEAKEEEGEAAGEEADGEEEAADPYDLEALRAKAEVDVWHWNDPLIKPHEKESWKEEKDRTYRAVVHLESGRVVALADREMRSVTPSQNAAVALGWADVPYLKAITWDGRYADLYTVDLGSGEKRLVTRRLELGEGGAAASLSPDGRFVVFYEGGDWHLHDVAAATTRNLTAELGVPFADEDWDYPSPAPSYGLADWLADGSAVLVYDKYDVWRLPSDGGAPVNLTAVGRERQTVFRVVDLDPDEEGLAAAAPILLEAYHDREKHDAFYAGRVDRPGVKPLLETRRHLLNVVAKAKGADRLLFTRERYDEFPDLRLATLDLEHGQLGGEARLSDVNPQITDFAWGSAELVEWSSADGVPLQGVLIKPGGYQPGKRYPVLVYYYRFFSQRLNEFNEPAVNHRPSFPLYASNGYAVFLPDIRFEIGRPGLSAVKCLVPGVQKLVDLGIADPRAIGLHGHSWSGYQTAFVITQTNLFAAAVAGAPVANMTSAYSGIRYGTGIARQFQYEKSQSRIGASLWEAPQLYLESSPVFYADRIETPLLIEFGDEDEAVPWTQGIELYLACRRLGKDCVFLQYRGEPHHLKKDANKLDYSIRMKEFFDHHLKGAPAPAWMTEGVPYRGK